MSTSRHDRGPMAMAARALGSAMLLLCAYGCPGSGVSVIGPVAGSVIVGDAIQDTADKLETVASNTTTRLSNAATDLLNQAQAALDGLRSDLNNDLTNRVDQLSSEAQRRINAAADAARQLEALVARDVDAMTQDAILAVRQAIAGMAIDFGEVYALQRVDRTLIPYRAAGPWIVTAHGVGIGFDSGRLTSTSELVIRDGSNTITVDGQEATATSVEFRFPLSRLANLRRREVDVAIEATLRFDVRKKKVLWLFGGRHVQVEQPIRLVLEADFAGEVTVSHVEAVLDWEANPTLNQTRSCSTPSGHGTSSSDVVHHQTQCSLTLPPPNSPPHLGDRRLRSYRPTACSGSPGNPCGWSRVLVADVRNGGTLGYGLVENWSHAITVTFTGEVEEFVHVADEDPPPTVARFYHSERMEVRAPLGFTYLSIAGVTRTGGLIDLAISRTVGAGTYPVPNDVGSPLQYLAHRTEVDDVVYTFNIR